MCKGPEAAMSLVCLNNREEVHIAGEEGVRGK